MAGRVLLGPGTSVSMQSTNKSEMKHSQLSYCNSSAPISKVEVKNIKSAGCSGLMQLQGKLFQQSSAVLYLFFLVGWLVYPSSSLGWRYGTNKNPGLCHQSD